MTYTFQWAAINLYLSSFGQKGNLLQKITDSPLIETIYRNTNLRISSFDIVNSPRPYGLMIGLPQKLNSSPFFFSLLSAVFFFVIVRVIASLNKVKGVAIRHDRRHL